MTQIKIVAETHATTLLGLTLHSPTEQAVLGRLNDALHVVGMLALPAAAFLTTFACARWLPDTGRASSARFTGLILVAGAVLGSWVLTVATPAPSADAAAYHDGWVRVMRLNPKSAPVKVNVGLQFADAGRVDEVIALYHAALTIDPDLREAHYNLGTALLNQGRFDSAATHLREALQQSPEDAATRRNLGLALARLDRPCDAVTHLRRSTQLEPSYAAEASLQRRIEALEFACAGVRSEG